MLTIRKKLLELLSEEEMNAMEISQVLSIREKEVYEHLVHISRTAISIDLRLIVTPYRCLGCGYTFKDRSRFNRPGRCPKCRGSHIQMATYSLQKH